MDASGIYSILGQQTLNPLTNVWGWVEKDAITTHLNNKNGHTFFGHVTLHTSVRCFIFTFSYPLHRCASSPWHICEHAGGFWHLLPQPSQRKLV